MSETAPERRDPEPAEEEIGDPVCWLDRLCPECGAMPSEDDRFGPRRCWRCGS
ncbi:MULTISPECIES: hypothetical protein [Pseudonocardia]|uniref:Uncharacterized protein n=1 Tax=Pseudonocardia saturnea TaxID=33909 RepID=A0ABQ0S8V4_9PSEU|nr:MULTISPECIES: hypothetical protein [Pseudonocardia]BBF99416.1 hypothetical protein Pdca_06260 [Pseudonocardia autotrophica]GEC29342.1 hypothetical protein PSA01_63710 [Pseudonocardia saturnea]